MGFENSTGLNTFNHYGPRKTGGSVGVEHSKNSIHQLSVYLTADSINGPFVPPVQIPAGARFIEGFLTVDEAFTGVTALTVGAKGTEGTNGVVLTTIMGTVGTKAIPVAITNGTWAYTSATGTAAASMVGVTKTGTATAGRGTVTLSYYYKDRG